MTITAYLLTLLGSTLTHRLTTATVKLTSDNTEQRTQQLHLTRRRYIITSRQARRHVREIASSSSAVTADVTSPSRTICSFTSERTPTRGRTSVTCVTNASDVRITSAITSKAHLYASILNLFEYFTYQEFEKSCSVVIIFCRRSDKFIETYTCRFYQFVYRSVGF